MQYWTCPLCGANLDRNEKCDCQEEKEREREFFNRHLKMEPKARQLAFVFDSREVGYESKNCC